MVLSQQFGVGSGTGFQRHQLDLRLHELRFRPLVISIPVSSFFQQGSSFLGSDRSFSLCDLLIDFLYEPVRGIEFGQQFGPLQLQFQQFGFHFFQQ